jgi:hypothetical protein
MSIGYQHLTAQTFDYSIVYLSKGFIEVKTLEWLSIWIS